MAWRTVQWLRPRLIRMNYNLGMPHCQSRVHQTFCLRLCRCVVRQHFS